MQLVSLDLRQHLEQQGRWLAADAAVPELEPALYAARYRQLQAAQAAAGLDALVIYADREHSANLAWLTGFSPRFEEAICVLVAGRRPTLLLGNENLEYARHAVCIEADFVLHQALSLPDQDRSRQRGLRDVLRDTGLGRGLKVGAIGWKPSAELEIPFYIATAVGAVTGELPSNAAALLMHAQTGLRATLEPPMLRLTEYAARLTSQAVLTLLANLRVGMPEREAAGHLNAHGLELSCHTMVNFAREIPSGLGSPRNRPLQRGGYAQVAFGVIGGLTCRAGRVAARDDADADDYLELLADYLRFVKAWYAALRVGATGGEVWQAADVVRSPAWQLALNPGHLLHLEEWLGSPFSAGSPLRLCSGMALQQDIIPVPRSGCAVMNMEDGLALADAELQQQLERLDPGLMRRCRARREQMLALGYELSDDVLPLSDSAGVMTPFLLEQGLVARVA